MPAEQTLGTYREYLKTNEVLPPAVRMACEYVEAHGWRVQNRRTARGFRYWCGCDTRHEMWLSELWDDEETVDANLNMKARKSCLPARGGE